MTRISANPLIDLDKHVGWEKRSIAVGLLLLLLASILAVTLILREMETSLVDAIASSERGPVIALYNEAYTDGAASGKSDDWESLVIEALPSVSASQISVAVRSASDSAIPEDILSSIKSSQDVNAFHKAKGIFPIRDGQAEVSSWARVGPEGSGLVVEISGPIREFGPSLQRTVLVVWAVVAGLVAFFIVTGGLVLRGAIVRAGGLDRLTRQLQADVLHDPTTGAMSRVYFDEIAETEIAGSLRRKRSLGMMLIHVPDIGDARHSHGRDAFEGVMARIAGHIAEILREADTVARFANDQFILLLPDSEADAASGIGERILDSIARSDLDHTHILQLAASIRIGVSSFPKSGDDIGGLIAAAEVALICADLSEINHVQRFDSIRSFGERELTIDRVEARLRSAGLSTCIALSNVIEEGRLCCTGHQKRVADLSDQIAEVMDIDVFTRQALSIAGNVHDLGMISAREDDLEAYRPGDSQPPRSIRDHPAHGVQLLNLPRELHAVEDGVMYHHENYDGSGYPQGISAGDIPIVARILRVADAYDHLTCQNENTEAQPGTPMEIMNSKSKTWFDPMVLEALVTAVGQKTMVAV